MGAVAVVGVISVVLAFVGVVGRVSCCMVLSVGPGSAGRPLGVHRHNLCSRVGTGDLPWHRQVFRRWCIGSSPVAGTRRCDVLGPGKRRIFVFLVGRVCMGIHRPIGTRSGVP